jgi:hypothetical protein
MPPHEATLGLHSDVHICQRRPGASPASRPLLMAAKAFRGVADLRPGLAGHETFGETDVLAN